MEAVVEEVGDVDKVAILNYSDNSAYVGARDIWMETAEGLGIEVAHQEFPTTTQDFGPIVSNVLKARPDVIFLGAAPATIGPLIKQIRNGGIDAPFVGDAGMFDPQVYEVSGGESVGSYSNTGYLATENASNEEFIATYQEEFGREPSSTAAYAYDLTDILLDAIERAGSTDRQAIRDALASTSDFPGLTGEISFGEEGGDAQRTSISLVRLADEGRLEKVADIPLG
jgi:branched-chain amino acid transport system substrate-binding protein